MSRPVECSWGRAAGAGLLCWLAACSEAAPTGEASGSVEIRRVERSLLLDETARTVLAEHPGSPVSVALATPLVGWGDERRPKASLVMAPPAEVRYELPAEMHPETSLHVELGFRATAYEETSRAKVRFEVWIDGELAASEVRRAGQDVRPDRRTWRPLDLPVGSARNVSFRTGLEATRRGDPAPDVPLEAAFALLELSVPEKVQPHPSSVERPNVLVILVDTLRADRLGTYGYGPAATTVIDALAERGTLFEEAFAPSSWTWPSTASLFTGQAPAEHGFESAQSCFLSDELVTLAEVLRSEGLATVAFSANPLVSSSRNFDQGFESFRQYRRTPAAEMLPDIEEWLRAQGDERFFMYLHWYDPHGPYEPDPAVVGELLPPVPEGYRPGICREILRRKLHGEPFDAEQLARFTPYISALYDAEVAGVDRATGALLALLAELDLERRTLIIVTSDHGEEFLEHGLNGHAKQLYDESVSVPLILAGPGVPAGRRVSGAVEMRHLGATLERLAGVEERELAGVDLFAERGEPEPLFFSVTPGRWAHATRGSAEEVAELLAMRAGSWLLVWAPAEEGRPDDLVRLFDLQADPAARRDVARESANAARVSAMREAIARWLERCRDRRPTGLAGGAETFELLRQLGYFDDE